MRIFLGRSILALAIAGLAGCSSSTTTNPTPTNTTPVVTYMNGSAYTYKQNGRDAQDKPDTTSTDTVKTTVVAINQTYQGKTNVTFLQNKHSKDGSVDTTYISQDSGNYWHYNYGLEAINGNQAIVAQLGAPVDTKWVLQAKLAAKDGDTWTAADENVAIGTLTSGHLVMSSVEVGDTTILIAGGGSTNAKHVRHTVSLTTAIAPVTGIVDTYVSANLGMTINIVHSTSVNAPGIYSGPVSGTQSILIAH